MYVGFVHRIPKMLIMSFKKLVDLQGEFVLKW